VYCYAVKRESFKGDFEATLEGLKGTLRREAGKLQVLD